MSDAYDTEGYIDYLTVRGFVLDNRFNFRRDGLPINAETSIPLDNKARVEVLKGTERHAGRDERAGRPRRPTSSSARSMRRCARPSSNGASAAASLGSVDLSQRFGADDAFGVRLNAAAEHLDPLVRNARGNRNAVRARGRLARRRRRRVIEAEVENSHRSQPSQPGFSMLGDSVPAPVPDPRLNLNNQPWSLPVVFDATTASLRLQQKLGADWRFVAHAATQRLRTDDRIAFPFGCCDPEPGARRHLLLRPLLPERHLRPLRLSQRERAPPHRCARRLAARQRRRPARSRHALSAGVLRTVVRNRLQPQAFNFAGTGNVDGTP